MGLSRTRERDVKRLRAAASDIWDDQKDVIEHASKLVRAARHQAAEVGREEVAPRVREVIDHHVRPGIESGVSATRSVADSTRDRLTNDVLPAVSSALASALAVLEVAKDPRVREVMSRAAKTGSKAVSKVAPAKNSSGPGKYILIGLGVVAVAGIAYAAWQTLRADDELWVSDDEDELDENEK